MHRPWIRPFPPFLLEQIETLPHQALLPHLNQLAQELGLVTGRGLPLQFVPQQALPPGTPYEAFIAETGAVPTRDNLHDRYNALMWLTAPLTKALLNRHQATVIQEHSATPKRGPIRDAATLWDENLAVVAVSGDGAILNTLMRGHDWQGLFIRHRQEWSLNWPVFVFGHALLEKLATPFKSITAHTLVIPIVHPTWADVDRALSLKLANLASAPEHFTTQLFSPLPLMGIPEWHPGNAQPDFYDDPQVFRPARPLSKAG